jgi:glycosyltransferase involved in cell wall biosynthesis
MGTRRLLVVIDEMEVGGSQRQVVHLLANLDRGRWIPELVYFRERSFLIDMLEQAGVKVHHIPKRGRFDPRFFLTLSGVLRNGHYNIVHAFSLTAEFWTLLALRLMRQRPPFVGSIRGLYLRQSKTFWRVKRFVLARSAAIISNSAAGADVAAGLAGNVRVAIDVIGNGVPLPERIPTLARSALRARIGVPEDRVCALFVGRLVEQKNVLCLLDAMATLPATKRPWLALAGDGPLRARLAAHAEAIGVDAQVAFLGERGDATALMQAADFLVLPSHEEGLSNALLEAMAAGCPVIASAVGGNPELIEHGQTGLLFPDDDRAALAVCMSRLVSDPELRQTLSRQARAHAENRHSIAALVAATQSVYERCIESATVRALPQRQTLNPSRHA